jgi:hypothetical protein
VASDHSQPPETAFDGGRPAHWAAAALAFGAETHREWVVGVDRPEFVGR